MFQSDTMATRGFLGSNLCFHRHFRNFGPVQLGQCQTLAGKDNSVSIFTVGERTTLN
jgi:hypothetical protein